VLTTEAQRNTGKKAFQVLTGRVEGTSSWRARPVDSSDFKNASFGLLVFSVTLCLGGEKDFLNSSCPKSN
jgi:hypothetical protein